MKTVRSTLSWRHEKCQIQGKSFPCLRALA